MQRDYEAAEKHRKLASASGNLRFKMINQSKIFRYVGELMMQWVCKLQFKKKKKVW